jgi:histone H3/H4
MKWVVAKAVAAHAGRKNIKRKDIEFLRTYAAMMGLSSR